MNQVSTCLQNVLTQEITKEQFSELLTQARERAKRLGRPLTGLIWLPKGLAEPLRAAAVTVYPDGNGIAGMGIFNPHPATTGRFEGRWYRWSVDETDVTKPTGQWAGRALALIAQGLATGRAYPFPNGQVAPEGDYEAPPRYAVAAGGLHSVIPQAFLAR